MELLTKKIKQEKSYDPNTISHLSNHFFNYRHCYSAFPKSIKLHCRPIFYYYRNYRPDCNVLIKGITMKEFKQLFIDELKDIYSAEKQIQKALPRLLNEAKSSKLKETIKKHHDEADIQIDRLESIGSELKIDFKNASCEAMEGILKESNKVIETIYPPDVKDAAIISFIQRIEHYEIAVYGALKAFAKHLKLKKIEELLSESLKEEKNADKALTEIAEGTLFNEGVNQKASQD